MESIYVAGIPEEPIRREIRRIQKDVEQKTGIPVENDIPHITLKIPFDGDKNDIRETVQKLMQPYSPLPYQIDTFSHFDERVIYADVNASEQLEAFQSDLITEIRKRDYNIHEYDIDKEFHITIVGSKLRGRFSEVYDYITKHYAIQETTTLNRIDTIVKKEGKNERNTTYF